ncbi:MAG: hypothetical protein Q7S05_04615 [bacterium]|nr:hypothetical protein [bacterium]
MDVALICGGPSLERGISLNSARSILDHLSSPDIRILPFYLDTEKRAYRISTSQLYSNTPSDFDFKLESAATPLSTAQFVRELCRAGIVFPVMHGAYGEDGGIQKFLEKHRVPFVGSSSQASKKAFDKFNANECLKQRGFFTLPSALLKIYGKDHSRIVHSFFKTHAIRRAIVKPASSGSSIGVFSVSTPKEALEKVRFIFAKRMDTRVVIEQFAEGVEFTTILLQNPYGLPVALPPTEIETDYAEHQIFGFRKKYLPTRQVSYHCPPRFDDTVIERIQAQAEQLFAFFGMRDFARFDGWVLPSGKIWFCDFNIISGMEQNSFLFQQSARIGMTHTDVLRYIVKNACERYGIAFTDENDVKSGKRKPVSVLFGGPTSERQVSLMSGTNVWLKLRHSSGYEPHPFLLDMEGGVWRVPYHLTLNHTVEEISENCKNYTEAENRLLMFEERARLHLGLTKEKDARDFFAPKLMSLGDLIKESDFIFNALHGGEGEDGTMQALFSKHDIPYNGSDREASALCMDKWGCAEYIRKLQIEGLTAIPGTIVETHPLLKMDAGAIKRFWNKTRKELQARTLVVKPRSDGCSTGVVHLSTSTDLANYLTIVREQVPHCPQGTFKGQRDIIEMPLETPDSLIFERFIETDVLRVRNKHLKRTRRSGFVEATVGVIGTRRGLHALNPSITIADGEVLTVEEKFQGGTGVNLTPPPASIMVPSVVKKVRERMETLAKKVGITGYCRIDAFVNVKTGAVLVIEINTLPGLTPSTVLYHQGLAETPSVFPRELLETFIKSKGY